MSEISVFPLVGWDLLEYKGQPVMLFRPKFITGPMQSVDQSTDGPMLALTPAIAEELGLKLIEQARVLKARVETVGEGHLH